MDRTSVIRVMLVGGPMYDGLYRRIPVFERDSGYRVEVVARLPHPELNARMARDFGRGNPDIDLLSTHTKYAPSQARWLAPLDGLVSKADLADWSPRALELATIDGRLMQVPRNIDLRLLYYRRDLFESITFQRRYQRAFRKPLDVPETWDDLVDTATVLTTKAHAGFLFPGRDSGLFGTFYELLVSAGGDLFHPDLTPAFDSPAGLWAVDRLVELHRRREVTPAILPLWHYDDISAEFRRGHAAMTTDWPGGHYLYTGRLTSRVAGETSVAVAAGVDTPGKVAAVCCIDQNRWGLDLAKGIKYSGSICPGKVNIRLVIDLIVFGKLGDQGKRIQRDKIQGIAFKSLKVLMNLNCLTLTMFTFRSKKDQQRVPRKAAR